MSKEHSEIRETHDYARHRLWLEKDYGLKEIVVCKRLWLRGQAVKTSPFHGGNTGSIPVGVTI